MSGADQVSAIITDVTLATVYWLLATGYPRHRDHTHNTAGTLVQTEKCYNGLTLTNKKMLVYLLEIQ